MAGISRHRYLRFNIQKTIHRRDADGIEICEDTGHIVNSLLVFILEWLQFETVAANYKFACAFYADIACDIIWSQERLFQASL